MKNMHIMITALVALVLLVTGCSPQATPSAAPTSAPVAPVATSAPAAPAAPSGPAMVNVGKDAKLGDFLVDDKGMSLYLYTKDTPNTSNCYEKCATAWPPLLTSGKPAGGTGVDASKFGTTKRKDGTDQVTYNGWPLYYFAKDKKPGDILGQDVGKVWYLIAPSGSQIGGAEMPAATAAPAAAAVSGPANVMVGKNDTLGSFLVDDKGMTLYLFTKDTEPNTTTCYDKCATAWPPLLTSGAPVAGDGIDASKFGTATRKDGTTQVNYNGRPLYYYIKDTKPGDTTGQGVGSVWYVISPAGELINK
ncbi:MAG TPA: hypothetical protein VGK00_08395 [Anaerolineales bacterium]